MNTNTLTLITVTVTNWLSPAAGDRQTLGGTNYHMAIPIVSEQTFIQEVTLCTNLTLYRATPGRTNGPAQWQPDYVLIPHPLPMIPRRE